MAKLLYIKENINASNISGSDKKLKKVFSEKQKENTKIYNRINDIVIESWNHINSWKNLFIKDECAKSHNKSRWKHTTNFFFKKRYSKSLNKTFKKPLKTTMMINSFREMKKYENNENLTLKRK